MNYWKMPQNKEMIPSPAQQEAICFGEGAMLVLAGPGSGKTAVITQRIRYLVEERHITPSDILTITFTKAAALEMKQRACQICQSAERAVFGTFHSIFFQIIRSSSKFQKYSIMTEQQKLQILRPLLKEKKLDSVQMASFCEQFLTDLSFYKNTGRERESSVSIDKKEKELQQKGELYKSEAEAEQMQLYELRKAYEKSCRQRWLLDFDDILLECHRLLTEDAGLCDRWQRRFRYILIDEFQDTNDVQYQIIKLLSANYKNLFVVGDDDQAIYSFRGADPSYMHRFLEDFPQSRQVNLNINYRCGDRILTLAARSIVHNKNRFEKEIEAGNTGENRVIAACFQNRTEELSFLTEEILTHRNAKQTAILVRTNRMAELVAEACFSRQIPYCMREKKQDFYAQKCIREVLAVLRFVAEGRKRSDFMAFMNRPMRYISRELLQQETVDLQALLQSCREDALLYQAVQKLQKDLAMVERLDPFGAISYIRKVMLYDSCLSPGETGEKERQALDELLERCREFHSHKAFLSHIETYRKELEQEDGRKQFEADPGNAEQNLVQIMTYHGSKGLEFDTVFLPFLNSGDVPHGRNLSVMELEEERRLFYVAVTRAKKSLYLSCEGRVQGENRQSVFWTELKDYLESLEPSSISSSNST
ncbi:ATP-dependent helicase [Kineothrix sp. MSJ-39]|uniref:ATP-dependent helicase n=1 Tax=Kineothrix sp. MSJ-39 TaxID=2841533 RepID=UPI001C0F68A0|nr:ATP-dependent helicase [Kineothrix sp. MSJ-39]MBU5428464.1 ATP-dependent helicase [Kineothrix sp. MSJ-39]